MTEARRVLPYIGTDADGTFDSRYYTKTEVDALLASISAATHDHNDLYFTEAEVTAALAGKAASAHTHDDRYFTESETNTLLSSKSDVSHAHDDRYFTETEVNSLLAGKANTAHTHAWNTITGVPAVPYNTGVNGVLQSITTTTVTTLTSTTIGPLTSGVKYIVDASFYVEGEGIAALCDAILRISFGGVNSISPKRSRWEQGVDTTHVWHALYEIVGSGSTLAVTGQVQRVSGTPGTLDVEKSLIVVTANPSV